MIYDVTTPQFQQFLRSTARRQEAQGPKKGGAGGKAIAHKAGGAASTGL
jgi:hypothetical protein